MAVTYKFLQSSKNPFLMPQNNLWSLTNGNSLETNTFCNIGAGIRAVGKCHIIRI